MASPSRGVRGQFDATRYPNHFLKGGNIAAHAKQTASEKKILDNVTHGPITSTVFSTNKSKRFSIYTTGTLEVTVEESPDAVSGPFESLGTATPTTPFKVNDLVPFIRVVTTTGTGDAILFRDYKDGSE